MNFANIKNLTIPEGDVKKIEIGGNVVWQKSLLPSTYQQVEWIKGGTTQYINLNLKFLNFDSFNIEISREANYAGEEVILGTQSSSSRNYLTINTSGDDGLSIKFLTNNTTFVNGIPINYLSLNDKNLIKCSKTTTTSTIKYGEYTQTNNQNQSLISYSSYLFNNNWKNSLDTVPFKGKIYYLEFFKNNQTIRKYIPCYRKSDNVIGMYEVVNNVFYVNNGSGTFTKGNDI